MTIEALDGDDIYTDWLREQQRHASEIDALRQHHAGIVSPVTELLAQTVYSELENEERCNKLYKAVGQMILDVLPVSGCKMNELMDFVEDFSGAGRSYSGPAFNTLLYRGDIELTVDRIVTRKTETVAAL